MLNKTRLEQCTAREQNENPVAESDRGIKGLLEITKQTYLATISYTWTKDALVLFKN